MSFQVYKNGKVFRHKEAVIDCSDDEPITEQAHRDSADINKIIAKHGLDIIQKTAMLQSNEYRFDDMEGNDFQEAMEKVTKAQQSFDQLPHQIRKEFDNNPAKFLDFVQNPENTDKMVKMGLIKAPPEPEAQKPVEVVMVNNEPASQPNPETPTG